LFQHPIVPIKKTNSTSFNKVFAAGYLAAYAPAQLLASSPLHPDICAGMLLLTHKKIIRKRDFKEVYQMIIWYDFAEKQDLNQLF